ncbi:MAG: DUF3126 family protein [Parvularculales bacterium]
MNNNEILRVQTYMQNLFGCEGISVRRGAKDDSAEVYINGEFIGTMFRDDEDGEVSYAFQMAILEFDLPVMAEEE